MTIKMLVLPCVNWLSFVLIALVTDPYPTCDANDIRFIIGGVFSPSQPLLES